MLRPVEPIIVLELFLPLHAELLQLLRGLSPEAWYKPTAAGEWTVKDMVARLLDTDMRRLSFQRDRMAAVPPPAPITS